MGVLINWPERIQPGQTEIEVIITGQETAAEALDELAAELPASWGDMGLSTIGSLDRVPGQIDVWKAKPVYKLVPDKPNKGQLQPGEFEFAFSSSRQTIKRTVSLESVCFPEPDEPPHDLQLIGCDTKTGAPRGVDVVEYLNAFRWRVAVPFSTAVESWRRTVGGLRGTLNNATFFGYDARSVKFEDITGSVKANGLYVFDLSFTQKDHQTGVTIGGISVGTVDAWSVIDTETEPEEQTVNGKTELLPKVKRVKVHRVDRVADWSLITAILGMS